MRNSVLFGNDGNGITLQPAFYFDIDVMNTIISENGGAGVLLADPYTPYSPTLTYNNVWSNSGGEYVDIADPTGSDGNLSDDPGFVSTSGTDPYGHAVDGG